MLGTKSSEAKVKEKKAIGKFMTANFEFKKSKEERKAILPVEVLDDLKSVKNYGNFGISVC